MINELLLFVSFNNKSVKPRKEAQHFFNEAIINELEVLVADWTVRRLYFMPAPFFFNAVIW